MRELAFLNKGLTITFEDRRTNLHEPVVFNYKGGIVAYSNEVKECALGVQHTTLAAHGAVSEETVREMVEGVRSRLDSDYAIATTGIAGPTGGTPDKPVGTVWVAVCSRTATVTQLMPYGDCQPSLCYVNTPVMPKGLITILMLVCSNVFMTFAWYGNLKLQQMNLIKDWPLIGIIVLSWGMAFFEYTFMIPANRIGSQITGGPFSLMQLKVIQECVSLVVFTVIVATVFKGEPIRWNHLVAFGLIILAVFFAFMKTE